MTVPNDADQAHGDFPHCYAVQPLNELERQGRRDFRFAILGIASIFIVAAFVIGACSLVFARDDGHYAAQDPALHAWFDRLASGKGLCCSFADGLSIEDVDWDTTGGDPDFPYRVRLYGQWVKVPKAAVVTEPNKYGAAVVWPYKDSDGTTQIRCFMPGAGA